jgi:hypothetical protein
MVASRNGALSACASNRYDAPTPGAVARAPPSGMPSVASRRASKNVMPRAVRHARRAPAALPAGPRPAEASPRAPLLAHAHRARGRVEAQREAVHVGEPVRTGEVEPARVGVAPRDHQLVGRVARRRGPRRPGAVGGEEPRAQRRRGERRRAPPRAPRAPPTPSP